MNEFWICEKDVHCIDCPRNDPNETCAHWIEVAPVKHGRWVKAEPRGCWSYSEAYKQCSECDEVTFLAEKMSYCPNCGAKMDKGGDAQ